jgi:hypothetical protein
MWPFKRKKVRVYVPPPRSPRAPEGLRALRESPGPSPWYLNNLEIPCATGRLRWRAAGDTAPLAGKSLLINAAGLTVAVSDFYCTVKAVRESQMLVWYTANYVAHSAIRLQLFNVDQLRPISDLAGILPQLGASARFFTSTDPLAVVELSTALKDGSHVVSIPEVFSGLGDLFFLA